MNKQLKTALVGLGITAAVTGVGALLADGVNRTLAKSALNREAPKIVQKMNLMPKGYQLEEETLKLSAEAREKLEAQPLETVTIESFDGTKLVGHLCRAAQQKRVLLAMHGWRSTWSRDFGVIAPFWEENGCTVLFAEQRGQGESDGEYMGFGMVERFDCVEWLKWLNQNGFENVPIYLVGLSMGATTVLMASGSDELSQNVRGVIADCGFTSAQEILQYVIEKNSKISYRLHGRGINRNYRRKIHFDADGYSTLDALAVTDVPVLLIHGSADNFVPVQMSFDNFKACKSPKKLLVVDGAGHGLSYLVDQNGYEKAVLEFFATNDNFGAQEDGGSCLN